MKVDWKALFTKKKQLNEEIAANLYLTPESAEYPVSVNDLRALIELKLGKEISEEFMELKMRGVKPKHSEVIKEFLSSKPDYISQMTVLQLEEMK